MRNRLIPLGAVLLPLLGPVAACRAHAQALPGEPVVTSDTPEYCNTLMGRVADLTRRAAPSTEVAALSVEGERMCEHGRTRGGILRLRRVIVILSHPGG